MSYQALARKWRPRSFEEVLGQEHVVSALQNALNSQRIHHAFLFTGTRGVGKTTLARILARALNCEQDISATPCGECNACHGVDSGSFIDLIEVDAASRTKVDDTRELLDNVQYAPTLGRFKIYLIDEVHMLSTHSFNALLKTLEEPPAHVKFLLATTNPQKLPATILSRCIQFNLKAMDISRLNTQLSHILDVEQINYEPEALMILSRSADGSVRDALSLLDQAIAFGNGAVKAAEARAMLGMIDDYFTQELLQHACDQNGEMLLQTVSAMAERSVDFSSALDELMATLHNIALYKVNRRAVEWKGIETEGLIPLVERMDPELIQLFYQLCLTGKRDLGLAPDPRTGFEMIILRLATFQPALPSSAASPPMSSAKLQQESTVQPDGDKQGSKATSTPSARTFVSSVSSPPVEQPPLESEAPTNAAQRTAGVACKSAAVIEQQEKPQTTKEVEIPEKIMQSVASREVVAQPDHTLDNSPQVAAKQSEDEAPDYFDEEVRDTIPQQSCTSIVEIEIPETPEKSQPKPMSAGKGFDLSELATVDGWARYASQSGIIGISKELVMNMVPRRLQGDTLYLTLDKNSKSLFSEARLEKISRHCSEQSGSAIKLKVEIVEVGKTDVETPSRQRQRHQDQTQAAAEDAFCNDPNVIELIKLFDGEVVTGSITPGQSAPGHSGS